MAPGSPRKVRKPCEGRRAEPERARRPQASSEAPGPATSAAGAPHSSRGHGIASTRGPECVALRSDRRIEPRRGRLTVPAEGETDPTRRLVQRVAGESARLRQAGPAAGLPRPYGRTLVSAKSGLILMRIGVPPAAGAVATGRIADGAETADFAERRAAEPPASPSWPGCGSASPLRQNASFREEWPYLDAHRRDAPASERPLPM